MNAPALAHAPALMIAESREPDSLRAIHSPGCGAAIWRRRPEAGFQAWIDALPPRQLPAARLVLPPHRAREAVTVLCTEHGIADHPCRDMLVDDIAALAALMADVMRAGMLRLRLDVVSDNACARFHLDQVPARLLCTYRGRGTQYGPARGPGEADPVHELAPGSVGLFRGRLWSDEEPSGILHRSPPIAGDGETRLLLVIDPA